MSRILPDWRGHLSIVQPDTVIRWHRAGWRLCWRWRSNFNIATNPTAARTHLGLEKGAPEPRAVQDQDIGPVVAEPVLGGLHHRYYCKAA